jgi:UDP-glucose 4-epimerase
MIRDATILVTGGAGMVGSSIVDAALADGAREVRVLDNFSRGIPEHIGPALASGRCALIDADLRDPEAVRNAVRGSNIIFHQAAMRVTRCATEPQLAFESMAGGALNLFQAAVDERVDRVVAASSGVIYGAADVLPTPETQHPYHDTTMYGALKGVEEGMLRAFGDRHELPYVILRYANVYGPRCALSRDAEVLVHWMEAIDSGNGIRIDGDGTQTADFVYVNDIVRANILAANASVRSAICNVGTGIETSLRDLASALIRAMDADVPIVFGPPRGVNAVPRRALDGSEAERVLGFRPNTPLDGGLTQLVSWWRGQRLAQTMATQSEDA